MKHLPHPKLDYHKITEYIYIGTNQCCQTHFDERLLAKKIRADISLEKNRLDAPFGVDYYLWLPVADHKAPTARQLELGIAMLRFCVKHHIAVYVHCRQGHGRAPTLVAAYLTTTGMSVKEAVAHIKRRRPITHLNPVQVRALARAKLNK
ncbi:dual specificity protein phosphatase family protein [Candidatus Uhrbacteria bacterium]|nr:dual specificity protein phosphatase family protein [Candidatus Uhrbacteria bacterium]